jgi:O-antigen/teichoic acid export membrane protein
MPRDFGLMTASAAVLAAFVVLAEWGLRPALTVKERVNDDDLAVAWTLSLVRGLLLALAVWAFAGQVAGLMRMGELESLLRVHALVLLIQALQSPALALLSRRLDFGNQTVVEVVRRGIEAIVSIMLAFWLRNAWALLIGQLLGFMVGSALSYRIAPFRPRLSFNPGSLSQLVKYGRHANLTTILTFIVMSGGELLVGRLLGAEALGIYQVSLVIPMMVGVRLTGTLASVGVPTFVLLREERSRLLGAFSFELGMVSLVLIPGAIGLAILAPDLVAILFGSRWSETVVPLRILCGYAICAGLSGVMASLHYGMNRPDVQTRIWCVLCLLYAVVVVPLVVNFGLAGAAGALALCYAVGLLLHIRYTLGLLGREGRAPFVALGRLSMAVAAIASGLLLICKLRPEPATRWALVPYGLAGAMMLALYLWRVEYPRLRELWASESQ